MGDQGRRGSTGSSTSDYTTDDSEIFYFDGVSHLVTVRDRPRWYFQDSILDVIGQTPLVRVNRMATPGVNVYVKCENINPGGSVKDRLAAGIIEWAEMTGALQPGQTVVEASSGNTGM